MEIVKSEEFDCELQIVKDDTGNVWFKGFTVAQVLGYTNTTKAIRDHVREKHKKRHGDILPEASLKGNAKNIIFINETGFKELVVKSRLPIAVDMAKAFNIDILDTKYLYKEQESLNVIMKAFQGETMIRQHPVECYPKKYRVDLYFPEHKIAVECDENGHADRDPDKEKWREIQITRELHCEWVRFNPDAEEFNIFDVINKIQRLITLSLKPDRFDWEDYSSRSIASCFTNHPGTQELMKSINI